MPQVSGDTLTGWTDDNMQVRILFSDVASVAVAKVNGGRTTTFVVLSGVVLIAAAWFLIGLHDLANQN